MKRQFINTLIQQGYALPNKAKRCMTLADINHILENGSSCLIASGIKRCYVKCKASKTYLLNCIRNIFEHHNASFWVTSTRKVPCSYLMDCLFTLDPANPIFHLGMPIKKHRKLIRRKHPIENRLNPPVIVPTNQAESSLSLFNAAAELFVLNDHFTETTWIEYELNQTRTRYQIIKTVSIIARLINLV